MSSIFDARQEEIIFVQLEREPLFSEDLRDARKIIKQCWDVVGVDKCVIYNCFAIAKDLGNICIGWYTIFCRIKKNGQFIMKNLHHGSVKGRFILMFKRHNNKKNLFSSGVKKANFS